MLQRTPVPQTVARRIQSKILSGELKPGQRIPSQREFSLELKVSRASLREALLTLETLGLIKTEPGRGTFIADQSAAASSGMIRWRYADDYSVADVFQTRLMLEARIAALAAPSLSAQQLNRLSEATDVMERCWEAGDLLANVEADLDFHGVIVSACPNRMLGDLYYSVRDLITETQIQPIPITKPTRMRESISEHRRLIEALRQADASAAATAMRRHIENTARCAGIEID